jgi:MSHA biogenesis protein MshQ
LNNVVESDDSVMGFLSSRDWLRMVVVLLAVMLLFGKNGLRLFFQTFLFAVAAFLCFQNAAIAAVAHDAASESHTGTTASTNQASFSWTHTPAGTPRGVLVFVFTNSATQTVASVTYGGTAMTAVAGGVATDTAGELGRVDTFFLGASILTGARTVVVNRTNNAINMYATAITQTATADTETTGIVLLQESGAYAQQLVNDGSPGTNSVRYAGGYAGGNNVLTAGANSTILHNIDRGSYTFNTARETTAGQGARNVGFTGSSDDRAGVHLAVREIPVSTVVSINRAGVSPTSAPLVSWTVIFNKSVTGVDATAFALAASGLSGAYISSVTGSGTTWTVTANTGIGSGTLGLNQTGPGSGSPTLTGTFTGQVYTISATPALAEYRMDEAGWSGTAGAVVDSSGSYPGTAINSANTTDGSRAIPGNPGTCRYGVFDNGGTITQGYVGLPGFPNLNTDFTITGWIRSTNITVGAQRILIDDETNTGGYGLSLGEGGTGILRFYSRGSSAIILDTAPIIANNTWYFVAGVADISNGIRRIYVYDAAGTLLTTVNVVSTGWGIDAGMASIGGETSLSSEPTLANHFKGNIDELRVYPKVLSQSALTALAAQTHACAVIVPTPGGFNAYETTTTAGATTGVIKTRIAGSTVSLDMIALNTAKTAILTGFVDTVRVEVLDSSNNSGALDANSCRSTWTTIQTLSPDPAFIASNNGRKTISFTVPDAYSNVRLRITYPAGAPTTTGCSTDNFAIRPNAFTALSVSDADWMTAGIVRTLDDVTFGSVTHKAGRPFRVSANAVNAAGAPAITANYTGTPTAALSACTGAACTATFGALSLGTTFVAGQLASNVATYDNVGAFQLQLIDSSFAGVDASDTTGDCTAAGRYVCSASIAVGRFVPDHFAVSYNTPEFGTACSAGNFTYAGQTFNYRVTAVPVITVLAENAANNPTTLYSGSWWRITSSSLTGKSYTAASGALDTSGITGTDPVINDVGSGSGSLSFSSGTGLFFTRTTPQAPFNAEISLAINVIDADGVAYSTNPARFGQATVGNGIAFSGGKGMRFGRLRLIGGSGSPLLPLRLPFEAQYWTGTFFATNVADTCTTVASSNVGLGNYNGGLSSASVTAVSTLSAGRGTITLGPPGTGVSGSVDVAIKLGSSPVVCPAFTPPLTGSGVLPWLRGQWCGTAYDRDPVARARFGIRSGDEQIYMRENY